MTYLEFEDSLDRFFAEVGPLGADQTLFDKLPADLRAEAARSPKCAQLLTDWIWLHEQMTRRPHPAPSCDFAAKVVAAMKAPTATASSSGWASPSAALAYIVGLAAALMLAVLWNGAGESTGPQAQTASAALGREADLPASLQDAGVAYLALVKNISNTVRINDEAPAAEHQVAQADPPTPPVGKVIRGSTGNIMSAGGQLGTTIRPIADSAAGAFGFLFKSPAGGEKRSI